jgi:hypothetical protein
MFINDDFSLVNIHRSGWKDTIESLKDIDTLNVLIDVYVDATFGWRQQEYITKNIIPYKQDWIGFIHHTVTGNNNSKKLFSNVYFRQSLNCCKCLIVLSEDLKFKLSQLTNVPIFVLTHPTETPKLKFTITQYLENNNKQLLHIGNWMRNVEEFLNVDSTIQKSILRGLTNSFADKTSTIGYLNDADYDSLLSKNVVCVFLNDASAINTVIECIVRNTPIFINPLPAIKEYLGENYPLYVDNAKDVQLNDSKIAETTKYLENLNKERFTFASFKSQFCNILDQLNIKYKKIGPIQKMIHTITTGKFGRKRGGVTGDDRGIGVSHRRDTPLAEDSGHDFYNFRKTKN